nr:reverse transcriptase-like protein [Prochloraceae cyanobacterium]
MTRAEIYIAANSHPANPGSSQKNSAYAVVLRNEAGTSKILTEYLENAKPSLAQALALKRGLKDALDRGIKNISLKSENTKLVGLLAPFKDYLVQLAEQKQSESPANRMPENPFNGYSNTTMKDIGELIEEFDSFECSEISTSCHNTARDALDREIGKLRIKHFDPRLKQYVKIQDREGNEQTFTEKLDNTLLKAFFGTEYYNSFSFLQFDEYMDEFDLKAENHPEGHVLLLSHKKRMLYGPPECLDMINKLCPDPKDRGAYASIFLGNCPTNIKQKVRILIVDDENGDNNGVLDNLAARSLVGDCHGKITPALAKQLSSDGRIDRTIQHRIGFTENNDNDNKLRFGKGTVLAKDLNSLSFKKPVGTIDLILPKSSFKGGDKKNNPIQPGIHEVEVWMGNKEESKQTQNALSQIHANFPEGIKDYADILAKQAKDLADFTKNRASLAKHYCEKYEENIEQRKQDNESAVVEDKFDYGSEIVYNLLKNDLENLQLLESPIVIKELEKFVKKEQLEIAIGKTILFQRGMIVPSKSLKNGEIFVPWLKDAENVVNFRSPLLNSNGMCVSKNKYLKEELIDGEYPLGTIFVSDETHIDIVKRINLNLKKEIDTYNENNPANPIDINDIRLLDETIEYDALSGQQLVETVTQQNKLIKNIEKQLKITINEQISIETDGQRQARDFDGDCIGVAPASLFPSLTAEVIRRNLPENAYLPTIKAEKASFIDKETNFWPFEKIALFMADSISVGIINNHLTAISALESELEIVSNIQNTNTLDGLNPARDAGLNLAKKLYDKAKNLIDGEKADEDGKKLIPDQCRPYFQEIVKLYNQLNNTNQNQPDLHKPDEKIAQIFKAQKEIYRFLISEAAKENQVAVDMFKSANKPNLKKIQFQKKLLYRQPSYIKDKKLSSMYSNGEMLSVDGYSPVEVLIAQANKLYEASVLKPRLLGQFRDLFKNESYTALEYNRCSWFKKEYDRVHRFASQLSEKQKNEDGPVIKIKTVGGNETEIVNLASLKHPNAFNSNFSDLLINSKIPLKINSNPDRKSRQYHKFTVLAPVFDENGKVKKNGSQVEYQQLGHLSQLSDLSLVKQSDREGNEVIFTLRSGKLAPGLSDAVIKAQFDQAAAIATQFRESIPPDRVNAMARATWELSHPEVRIKDGKFFEKNNSNRFVYQVFGDVISEKVKTFELNQLTVNGITKLNEFTQDQLPALLDTPVAISIEAPRSQETPPKALIKVNDKLFGAIDINSSQLPIGTTAQAKIDLTPGLTTTLKMANPSNPSEQIEIKFGKINNLDYLNEFLHSLQTKIKFIKQPGPDSFVLSFNGRKIGSMDEKSTEICKNLDQQIDLTKCKFEAIQGENDRSSYLLIKTPNEQYLRVNFNNANNFNEAKRIIRNPDNRTRITRQKSKEDRIYVQFEKDDEIKTAGYLTQKNERNKIKDNNIKFDESYNAAISTNFTAAHVTIDPETVKYPAGREFVFHNPVAQTISNQPHIAQASLNRDQTLDLIFKTLERQTEFLFTKQQDWLDTNTGQTTKIQSFGISVDRSLKNYYQNLLEKEGVQFFCANDNDNEFDTEHKRGYTVFIVKNEPKSQSLKYSLKNHFGEIYDANPRKDNEKSPYHVAISKQLTLEEKQNKDRLKNRGYQRSRIKDTENNTSSTVGASTATATATATTILEKPSSVSATAQEQSDRADVPPDQIDQKDEPTAHSADNNNQPLLNSNNQSTNMNNPRSTVVENVQPSPNNQPSNLYE